MKFDSHEREALYACLMTLDSINLTAVGVQQTLVDCLIRRGGLSEWSFREMEIDRMRLM
jgi:hypothetical protein